MSLLVSHKLLSGNGYACDVQRKCRFEQFVNNQKKNLVFLSFFNLLKILNLLTIINEKIYH